MGWNVNKLTDWCDPIPRWSLVITVNKSREKTEMNKECVPLNADKHISEPDCCSG